MASSLEHLGIEEQRSWDVRFIRRSNDWEMGGVDEWCGDPPLQLTFPSVYEIASNKEALVASSLEQLGIEERRS